MFRFFLEWLKNEMHEEAYARLVKQAERREMTMRTQQIRELNNAGSSPGWVNVNTQAISEPKDATVEYGVTDQMYKLANSFVSSLDDMWQSYVAGVDEETAARSDDEEKNESDDTKQEQDNIEGSDQSDQNKKRKHPQLWELAQAEGDDEWLEWIKNHIWTYIGLSAPLLGAANPLRAVLSGENMGLPMTEKNARSMELCK